MFSPGDRVEHADLGAPNGTVEHADAKVVCVKWDDGKVGVLYFDHAMVPNAHRLVKLSPTRAF